MAAAAAAQEMAAASKGQAWFCATGLPSDVVVEVGDMAFHLHKFPLMARSKKLHEMIVDVERRKETRAAAGGKSEIVEEEDDDEEEEGCPVKIKLADFPGGAAAFEAAAKFCYGVKLDMSPATAPPLICAAEHLGMVDSYSEHNLAGRADRHLSQCLLRSAKDAVRALKSCEPLLPLADELGLVQRCVDAIAVKAAADAGSLFGWPVSDRKSKSKSSRRTASNADHSWLDDLAGLSLPAYRRVVTAMKARDVNPELVEAALIGYAKRSIPGLSRSARHTSVPPATALPTEPEQRELLEAVIAGLPEEKAAGGATNARFLFGLLRTANILQLPPASRDALERKIAARLETAAVDDLLVPSYSYAVETLYDVDSVERIVRTFLSRQDKQRIADATAADTAVAVQSPPAGDAGRRALLAVGRLLDGYLAEIATDANLKPDKFVDLALILPDEARVYDDGLYRAVDIYLKAHPQLSEETREKVSGVIDGRKLTLEACAHAAENERLPLRAVVQVLFVEQLQLRQVIEQTLAMATGEEEAAGDDAEVKPGLHALTTLRDAVRGNQLLRLDMDSMRCRVHELERECSSMRIAIDNFDRRCNGSDRGSPASTAGDGMKKPPAVLWRLGCKFPTQVCDSRQRTVVAPPPGRPKLS